MTLIQAAAKAPNSLGVCTHISSPAATPNTDIHPTVELTSMQVFI